MIFILGIERSATTWVANILDHHSQTDVYMEPLSKYTSRLKQWPNRFTQLENFGEYASYFIREFNLLKNHRRFLWTRLSDMPWAWRTDLYLARILVRKGVNTHKLKDFIELNFHHQNRQIFVAKQPPLQTVIKEVRLNFNAELLPYLDKQANVLVIIREMASCVRSILEQIKQENLVELKRDLTEQYGKIDPQTICRYWIESYSVLIKALENLSISYKIVSHTKLLTKTEVPVDEIFNFLNFEKTIEVQKYLQTSNQSGSGKHNTQRSREELLEQIQEDRDQIYPLLQQELEEIRHHPILKKFVTSS